MRLLLIVAYATKPIMVRWFFYARIELMLI